MVASKVLQHLAPQIVDGAVALVGDDEVKVLDGQVGVVAHQLGRLPVQLLLPAPQRALLLLGVELGLAAQHGVEALDGGDAHLADRVQDVGPQPLDVVELTEPAAIVGGDVLLELGEGLAAQVVAVHQEEHPLRPGELDEAVDKGHGGEGLAAARGHLDEGPGTVLGEGVLQVLDGLHLRVPQPLCHQRRHLPAAAPSGSPAPCPFGQGLGLVEGEHAAAAWLGVALVPEKGLNARALVGKGQGQLDVGDVGRQADQIGARLLGHAAQGRTLGLGLDYAHGLAVDKEKIVGKAGGQGELAHGHARPGTQVESAAVLDTPPSRFEQLVNLFSGQFFRCGHGCLTQVAQVEPVLNGVLPAKLLDQCLAELDDTKIWVTEKRPRRAS